MRIRTSELRRAAETLLGHLEQTGHSDIDIREDFYWDVPQDQRYDSYEEPKELSVGQLSFDHEEIMKILSGESEPVNYGLVWLAAILRRAGEICPG